jgi:hypothetical protein
MGVSKNSMIGNAGVDFRGVLFTLNTTYRKLEFGASLKTS